MISNIHIFVTQGYDGLAGVFETLEEALKATEPNSSTFECVDEYVLGSTERLCSYTPDGNKWWENGKCCQ